MSPEFQEKRMMAERRLLRMHYEANAGHLGGNLSCLDAMLVLHQCILQPEDRFILSKGHSAGALYVALWSVGKLDDDTLSTFSKDDSLLPGHPSGNGIPGLLFSTGSLGHGPSLAAGLALAAKRKKLNHRIYCLCSDGEWQEGSCWEALTFAVHHQLDNLTILIDQNGLQGFGTTEEVISCTDLSPRIAAFGAQVTAVDGHDCADLERSLRTPTRNAPAVIIMTTRKGKGLPTEGQLSSHYLPLKEHEYRDTLARTELGEP